VACLHSVVTQQDSEMTHSDWQTYTQTDRLTDRQTDTHRDRQTD